MSSKPQLAGTKPDRDKKPLPKDPNKVRRDSKSRYIFNYGRALEPKYANPSLAGYYRPWRFTDQRYSGVSKVSYTRTQQYRISLDVSQFEYENISVRVLDDTVVIEAFHDISEDQLGKVKRKLIRKYKLPPDINASSIHGKFKKGFLFLWGERLLPDDENSDKAQVEEQIKNDRIVSSKKNPRPVRRHQLVRNDVKPLADRRLDKHSAAQFKPLKEPKQKTQNEQITIPITYSPGSPA